MKEKAVVPFEQESPPSIEEIKEGIRFQCEEIINFCEEAQKDQSFYCFEKALKKLVSQLSCLFFQLFLMTCHQRLSYDQWLASGLYYVKKRPIARKIKTIYGEVKYWRTYLIRKGKKGGGFYPLDAVLGLTRDGFSPLVMSLATKLATRVSFGSAVLLFRCFYGWAPSSESIEHLVLGIGWEASAYMEVVDSPYGDGEILVIECDGKATPSATEKELAKRRGKRKGKGCSCGCQRHRGKAKRKSRKRKRRKKGDKSKNGRSITIAVMYTLKIGDDGRLHGPINKKVWGSYAPRQAMFEWIRRQATKRGFPPGTNMRIHIAVDGEKCLRDGLSKLFPEATFALDIRHLEEKLWEIGRTFYAEGSEELEEWVEEKRSLLYAGRAAELVSQLKDLKKTLSKRAKRDIGKWQALTKLIGYMELRLDMMAYNELINEDLPIATGIVEGAARYVVGERMDCSGMRWIPGRAQALLHLRCIELNGEWDKFFEWGYKRWHQKLRQSEKVLLRTNMPLDLSLNQNVNSEQELSNAA